jgi:hypothetical protein
MLNWMSIGAEYVECPLYSVYEKGATVCGHVPARQVAVIAPPMQHDAAGSILHGGRQGERAYEQWVGQRERRSRGARLGGGSYNA